MMAPAAELMRQRRDVDLAHRPERYFDAAAADVAEQQRHANAGDRSRKLDDSVEIVRGHLVAAQRVRRYADPRQPDLRLHDQRLQHLGEQSHPAFGRAGIDRRIDRLGIDALLEQRGGDTQSAGRGVGEAESPGVGEQADVERLRDFGRQRPAGYAREVEHELCCRRRLWGDETRPRRQLDRTDVMIDADQWRLPFTDDRRQVAEPAQIADVERGDDIGALDLSRGTVARVGTFRNQKMETVGNGGGIGDADGDAAGTQQVPQPDLTADAVAVGVDVRRQSDVTRAGERRYHVASRLGSARRNGHAVRVHSAEDNRLVSGARYYRTFDLAPLVGLPGVLVWKPPSGVGAIWGGASLSRPAARPVSSVVCRRRSRRTCQ